MLLDLRSVIALQTIFRIISPDDVKKYKIKPLELEFCKKHPITQLKICFRQAEVKDFGVEKSDFIIYLLKGLSLTTVVLQFVHNKVI